MTLILLQVIIQSISSTLYWIGLYVGIRALPGERYRRVRWTVGSAAVLVVWLVCVVLLAANGVFRTDAPRIPIACWQRLPLATSFFSPGRSARSSAASRNIG
jgi:hypothetical protein